MLTEGENEDLRIIKNLSYDEIIKSKDSEGVPYLKKAFHLHQKIFKQTCTSCSSKIRGYIYKLKNLTIQKLNQMSEAKYRMKPGKMILVRGTSNSITNHNLTDEKAVELLAENPNRSAMFSKLPEDWEKEIKTFKPKNDNDEPQWGELTIPEIEEELQDQDDADYLRSIIGQVDSKGGKEAIENRIEEIEDQ